MTPSPTPEEIEQRLIDEAVRARIEHEVPRHGAGRRSEDGEFVIRGRDVSLVGGLVAIVIPLLAVAFYVRDIANQVSLVVREQSVQSATSKDHELRLKSGESAIIRLDGGATQRSAQLQDHESRIRALEGK
jgi:hypothetical protein